MSLKNAVRSLFNPDLAHVIETENRLQDMLATDVVHTDERGLSSFVYAYMVDRLRGVSEQVTIGRAWRRGEVKPAWFVLCRE